MMNRKCVTWMCKDSTHICHCNTHNYVGSFSNGDVIVYIDCVGCNNSVTRPYGWCIRTKFKFARYVTHNSDIVIQFCACVILLNLCSTHFPILTFTTH
jgi:hypothetical protein